MAKNLLVTGANGLIGSEVVQYFSHCGWQVYGIDNNMRADFFGPKGDTSWVRNVLKETCEHYTQIDMDIRERQGLLKLLKELRPDAVIHCAAQPSHDLAAQRPLDDFDVNAVGTLNLLEGVRQCRLDAPFIHLSTNKVYGDGPNRLNLLELETRWDYADAEYFPGIKEDFSIDQTKHSIFGASKVAADIMVQEYGRYFDMPTCCLRGGCLTGPMHACVELHGFLGYLIKCNVQKIKYNIFGYKGKQVRDNIHSFDVARFCDEFIKNPRSAEVYNLGGGRNNSISIREAIRLAEAISGIPMSYEYLDKNRDGDHICYISDISKIKKHYPNWEITKDLNAIFEEIYLRWSEIGNGH